MTGRWQSLKQNFLKCLIEKLTRFVWSHYLLFVCMLWFFFQVSWLQVLLLLLQVLCGIKVINKELSFPFLWQHKIVSLKWDWHGGGEKTKQIGTFNRKIFLLIVGLWTLGACMVWVLCLGPGLHITFNLQTWPQSECKKGFMTCRLKGYFQVLGCEVKLYRT